MDDKFYFPSKTMKPVDSLSFEEINMRVDSVQLTGILLKPTQKPKGTILFFHGAGGNVTSYLFMTRPLVQDGWYVLMIDFRGYGKSTGTPTHLNIAHDGQLILDSLIKRTARAAKVIIYGASMGTQIAAKLAKDNQHKIAGLVLDGTISSFTDIAADKSPEAQRATIRQYLVSPYSAKEDIKGVTDIPTLFIHNRTDSDVPFEEGQLVFNNAPGRKQFIEYKGKHLEAMLTERAAILEAIRKF